jgi:hypothetical protein
MLDNASASDLPKKIAPYRQSPCFLANVPVIVSATHCRLYCVSKKSNAETPLLSLMNFVFYLKIPLQQLHVFYYIFIQIVCKLFGYICTIKLKFSSCIIFSLQNAMPLADSVPYGFVLGLAGMLTYLEKLL